ncbi:PAS domain-containing protein [Natrarchaeobius halalkaliphilus]|uniref:histidine kinase n=1 Tax=Natrarchaeobius halalkaliphilus TaxID=1679091 RepID=A0A3N6P927_9EURY|nr:histidine kinase N-terminal 7TM domain-containing protein [Natrarchaeobius halalkaliphilus]RQG92725.1 PAS domain-containing protein [Natrarchaeobius halalkaliphilus]
MFGTGLPVGWPVVGSISAGLGSIALGAFLYRHRGKPGVTWFLGVFVAQTIWCVSYGFSLLIFDVTVRTAFEALTWLGIVWTGITFLGFALKYTGRGQIVHEIPFRALVGFGALSSLVVVTNGSHGLVWSGLELSPSFGVATVTYTFGPWAYLIVAVCTLAVASGVFLLVDTFISYGPLFRRETTAVALSTLPPGLALIAWTFELGPVPQLNLAPILFLPHVVLDAYAFGRVDMFERNPTTVRAAERSAIDDLSDPILVLTAEREVVRLNAAAETMLGVSTDDAIERSVDDLLAADIGDAVESGADIDPIEVGSTYSPRTYAISPSTLTDPDGTHVGYIVVCSDITGRERRRQQLEVLNRILRHNLRNDASVVHGYGAILTERIDDPELARMAEAIEQSGGSLAALGDKSGSVDELLGEESPTTVSVTDLVEQIADDLRKRYPTATIDTETNGEITVPVRHAALHSIVENSLENALQHHDSDGHERPNGGAWARLTLELDEPGEPGVGVETLLVTIEDDGPGVPFHEVDTVKSGRETALEHGSGLGMWMIRWAAVELDADVEYADREPRGTSVTIEVPVESDANGS